MKKIYILFAALTLALPLMAQDEISRALAAVEANNTTLKALREGVEAQKLENRTGIYLAAPDAEFNYLWGRPGYIGNRTDLSVRQTFDIPTLTGMKSRLADGRNSLLEWQYKVERMNILLEAKQVCTDLVYYNALKRELDMRLQHAETIAEVYKERLDAGDANILEYNKSQLNLATVQGEIARVDVERTALLSQLVRLNGGEDVVLTANEYAPSIFPASFADWYEQAAQKNPLLAYAKQDIEVSKNQVKLNRAMGLPVFSAGYMSEKVVGQQYQGLTVGVSIPLWENKNRIKQAQAAVRAAESRETSSRQQFDAGLQTLYNRAKGLKTIADRYRQSLVTANSTQLLKQALDAGEISLLDYIVEIGLYYNTVNQALEAERDYQKALAELAATEL